MNNSGSLKEKINEDPLVLIVDDIPKNLQLLSGILSSHKYQISFASNAVSALEVAIKSQPDLILLDIMMPEIDGFEVCKRLKEEPITKDIPVIFLTGRVESEDIVKGFELGAVDYITKPFNAVELLSRVKNHIELKKSRDKILSQNEELEKTQKELKKVIQSKDRFFSIISHDLRGPFSGFLGLSELLVDEFDELEKDEIVHIAKNMNTAANRLFELLENLLAWSSAQMDKIVFSSTVFDLSKMVEQIIAIQNVSAENKKITINNNFRKGININADPNMINTIFRNLISNAIKFTREKGIVDVNYCEVENYHQICIKDNGIGMPEKTLANLFQLETKETRPGTNNEQGSGLGLLLVKELVKKHKGNIEVESRENEGTVFTVNLPK